MTRAKYSKSGNRITRAKTRQFRMTDQEHYALMHASLVLGITPSEIIRLGMDTVCTPLLKVSSREISLLWASRNGIDQ